MEEQPCIGLFGSCDKIRWRDPFMSKYEFLGIKYFNPMVDDWNPGMVPLEAEHLAEDQIILFPILRETYGQGSLSEVGLGPLRAIRQNVHRSFVVLIDEDLDASLMGDAARAKDSIRSRKLVKGHLKNINLPNLYMVESLDQMLDTSIRLHSIHSGLNRIRALQA